MLCRNYIAFSFYLGSIFLIFPGYTLKPPGYSSVTGYNDMFLAAGSGGRIDWITFSGKITRTESFPGEDLNSIVSDNRNIIAAGDKGIIRISPEGKPFVKAESGTNADINSVIIFRSAIIAGADKGTIIRGDPGGRFSALNLNLKGNIVSLSARLSDCYGATDAGEIIHSTDGINWDIFDFNQVYKGYYKPCSFTSVLVTQNRIAVAGRQDDGSPVVAFSNQGNVWTERTLDYADERGFRENITEIPNSILYDEAGDQYILACNDGTLILLPACSQCNKITKVSDADLRGLFFSESKMMIVGDNFFTRIMNIGW